ncbi:MAG TPA: hypothetical protein VGK49_02300 [Ilumatobacteraceae bacterium]
MASAPSDRGYVAGSFALEIEGAHAGFLVSATGGEPFGRVVADEPVGARSPKHIGGFGITDIVIEVRAPLPAALEDWVASMMEGTHTQKSGAIVMLNYQMHVQERLEWTAGVITEVTFPAADAGNKEPDRVRVTIQPEMTNLVGGSGGSYGGAALGIKQKAFIPANFRFSLSGLEQETTKVSAVSSITVTRRVQEHVGEHREFEEDVVLDLPRVIVRIAQASVEPFRSWFNDFVINGQNDDGHERTATLTFLDPTRTSDLLRLQFGGVGIVRVARERRDAGVEVIASSHVELYCETIRLTRLAPPPPATTPTATPPTSKLDPVTVLAHAFVAALRDGSPMRSGFGVEDIADRLRSTTNGVPTSGDFDRGRELGKQWAGEVASLEELSAIAELGARDEWKAIALPEGHSLLRFLAATGDVPAADHGAVDLERDEFVAGIVAGATTVYRQVEPVLNSR